MENTVMENTTSLSKQDLMNICRGAGFFGSGGGGSVELTYGIIDYFWNDPEEKLELYDPKGVPDSSCLASVAMIGAPEALKKMSNKCKYASSNALKLLESKLGRNIEYLVSVETGSVNAIIPAIVSKFTGKPYVDCVGTSCSVPKLDYTTYAIGDIDSSPAAFANDEEFGVTQYLQAEGVVKVDEFARSVVQHTEFGQAAGFANFVMTGKQMKKAGMQSCILMAKELGEILYRSRNQNSESIYLEIKEFLNKRQRKSYLLGMGKIVNKKSVTSGGFDSIKIEIKTEDDLITVMALNENLLAWSAKKTSPIAMAPDLISYIGQNGHSYSNDDIKEGMEIMLIASQATEEMRKQEIIDGFMNEIKAMGYYGPYIKIEEIEHKN